MNTTSTMDNKQLLFSGRQYAEHATFWQQQLQHQEEIFSLQGGMSRKVQDPVYETFSFSLPEKQCQLLQQYTGGRAMESFILLLSSWMLVFSRYNTGSPVVACSPLLKTESLTTVWEEWVPLTVTVTPADSLRQLLEQVNRTVVQCYKYQNYPLDMLPGQSIAVLSNVLIRQEGLHMPAEADGFGVLINMQPDGTTELVYNTALYDAAFMQHISACFLEAVNALSALHTLAGEVNLLSEQVATRLTSTFNNTFMPLPAEGTVLSVFAEQVNTYPEYAAVIKGDQQLTYAALQEKSERLAAYLQQELGVKKGDYVGVMLEKSIDAVICLLGIMKAGAVYVPVDPQNPPERRYYMLEDAHIQVLLTDTTHMFGLDQYKGSMFAVDVQLDTLAAATVPLPVVSPEDTAYLIYTSGSTGKPKGVMIAHHGLLNVSLHHVAALEMTASDRYLQFMSLSFDGSLLDIFTALLSGAALVLPEKQVIESTERFLEYLDTHGVSIFTVTPSYLRTLNKAAMPGVRALISAGEAANADDLNYYAQTKKVYNGYGPSEITVNATLLQLDPAKKYDSVPIGKPAANKQVYIVDNDMRLQLPGLAGEICVAGIGLAQGYLNDAALTAQKFVPNPWNPGALLYKTGDLGYWLPDGNIEFAGRKDEQIKVNGFRIDPGEIEQALCKHPVVQDARVICTENNTLAAFIRDRELMSLVPSLGEYQVYDPFIYESMASDEMRFAGYRAAMKDAVKGKVVLDPGTGSEMILARHCIEAGAAKVYAVELEQEAYEIAKSNLVKYDLEGKVILILGDVADVEIPEKIDCVVSALAGNMASTDGCLPLMSSIRRKLDYPVDFLPGRYHTRIAAASLTPDNLQAGFSPISAHYISQVFDKYGYPFDVRLCIKDFNKACLLSADGICEDIRYNGELHAEEKVQLALQVEKSGMMTGFVCWINAFYNDLLMIDSKEKTHHLPVYLPLSGEGIYLEKGETVQLTFSRTLSDNGLNPDFYLEGTIGNRTFTAVSFNHKNTFRGNPLYAEWMQEDGTAVPAAATDNPGWQAFLQAALPPYMIPSSVTAVDHYPLTTNGKLDKKALAQLLDDAAVNNDTIDLPVSELELLLLETWQSVLGRKQISVNDDFFMLGGDSIKAIQIASRMLKAGYKLEVRQIFEHPVITALATVITPVGRIADQQAVTGDVPVTPVQYEVFFRDTTNGHHFNQAVMLHAPKGFGAAATAAVFGKIQEHHDALRMVFRKEGNTWQQCNMGTDMPLALQVFDLHAVADPVAFMEEKANALQTSMDLENGPLMKVALFTSGAGDRLLIIIHHLVVDGISWRILFEDIEKLYSQYQRKQELKLPVKTDAFKVWAEALAAHANSREFLPEIAYWLSVIQTPMQRLPKDFPDHGNMSADTTAVAFTLTAEETELLLTKVNNFFGAEINDVLLASLARAMYTTFHHTQVWIGMEGHGREDIFPDVNISRTVGWFSSFYPVVLTVQPEADLTTHIRQTRDALRKIPHKGIGYGILKHLTAPEKKAGADFSTMPQLSFNYLGQFDTDLQRSAFHIAAESTGNTQSDDRARIFDLDVKSLISAGRMHVTITYNKQHFLGATIQLLADAYRQVLQEMLQLAAQSTMNTAQFTYNEISQEDLDSIFS
jgi:amino acid adenylation domain-containing protein/non-ribosomal peptide synthase protein (TIGR01720 family)